VIGLSARRDKRWILDSKYRLLESNQLIRMPTKHSAEGRELHGLLSERSIRKEQGHGADLLKRVD